MKRWKKVISFNVFSVNHFESSANDATHPASPTGSQAKNAGTPADNAGCPAKNAGDPADNAASPASHAVDKKQLNVIKLIGENLIKIKGD